MLHCPFTGMALLLNLNTTYPRNSLSGGTSGAPTTTIGAVDSTLGALLIGTLIGLMWVILAFTFPANEACNANYGHPALLGYMGYPCTKPTDVV